MGTLLWKLFFRACPLGILLEGSSFGDPPLGSIAHILISFGNVLISNTIEKRKKKRKVIRSRNFPISKRQYVIFEVTTYMKNQHFFDLFFFQKHLKIIVKTYVVRKILVTESNKKTVSKCFLCVQ